MRSSNGTNTKVFWKISPNIIRASTEPLLTIIVMIPIAYCVVGPMGAFLGTYLSDFILWLYNTTGFLGVALLATIMLIILMTGMYSTFTPYVINMMTTVGYEPIFVTAMTI